MFDFLFEADLLPFLLGQVLDDVRHHRLELFVRLFAFLVVCLQRVVVREVAFVPVLKILELFSDPELCPK